MLQFTGILLLFNDTLLQVIMLQFEGILLQFMGNMLQIICVKFIIPMAHTTIQSAYRVSEIHMYIILFYLFTSEVFCYNS